MKKIGLGTTLSGCHVINKIHFQGLIGLRKRTELLPVVLIVTHMCGNLRMEYGHKNW